MCVFRLQLLNVKLVRLNHTFPHVLVVFYQCDLKSVDLIPIKLHLALQLGIIFLKLARLHLVLLQALDLQVLAADCLLVLFDFADEALYNPLIGPLLIHNRIYLCSVLQLYIVDQLLQIFDGNANILIIVVFFFETK